jgi:hypothetical protein
VGFRSARAATIEALRSGDFVHEFRDTRAEKNLLSIGAVSPDDVIALLRRSRGNDYSESPHHWDRTIPVHVFTPRVDGHRWYIKVYFIEGFGETANFISVHR